MDFRNCNFNQFLELYNLIKYDTLNSAVKFDQFVMDFTSALKKSKSISDEQIDGVVQILQSKTNHTTTGSSLFYRLEKEILGTPFLIELIIRTYYWDFKMFGFPLPKILFDKNNLQ